MEDAKKVNGQNDQATTTIEHTLHSDRVLLDTYFKAVDSLRPTAETTLAKRALQNSKMFLGKALQMLGEPNPYPNSRNPDSPVIEKTADTAIAPLQKTWEAKGYDRIACIKHLRRQLEPLVERLWSKAADFPEQNLRTYVYATEAAIYADKGMMWLGMELGRIAESGEGLPQGTVEQKIVPERDTFNNAALSNRLTKPFGYALEALKNGAKIARQGWNGKNMFLFLNKGSIAPNAGELIDGTVEGVNVSHLTIGDNQTVTRLPNINMMSAKGNIVTGWLASQTDMLADDWVVLEN